MTEAMLNEIHDLLRRPPTPALIASLPAAGEIRDSLELHNQNVRHLRHLMGLVENVARTTGPMHAVLANLPAPDAVRQAIVQYAREAQLIRQLLSMAERIEVTAIAG